MSWDYFSPASRSEGCSRQCGCTRVELNWMRAAWLPLPPALHPSPHQIGRERGIRKSFIRCVQFAGSWGAYVIQTCWAGRIVPDLRRIAEQMTRGDHIYRVVRRCPRCAAPSLKPIRINKIDLARPPLRNSGSLDQAPGHHGRLIFSRVGRRKSAIQSRRQKEIGTCEKSSPAPRPSSPFKITLLCFSSRGYSRGDRSSTWRHGELAGGRETWESPKHRDFRT